MSQQWKLTWLRLMLGMLVLGMLALVGKDIDHASAASAVTTRINQTAQFNPSADKLGVVDQTVRSNVEVFSATTASDGFVEVFTDTLTSTAFLRPEWYPVSVASLVQSPNGQIYMAGYGNQQRTLNLANLPMHSKVRLSFDFFTLYPSGFYTPWLGTYGTNPNYHHHFKVDTSTTPATDLDYTFCNMEGSQTSKQSYPMPYSDCLSGNNAIGSLGYSNSGSFKGDVRYRLSLTIDHTQSAFDALFAGTNGYQNNMPMWGIDNISVELLDARPPVVMQQPGYGSGIIGYDPDNGSYSTTLAIQAAGANPLTYQWYRNGVAIAGANSASLNVFVNHASVGTTYKVVVSNPYGTIESRTVQVILVRSDCTCDPEPA